MGEAVHSCNLSIGAAETGGSLDLTGLRESVDPRLSSSNVSRNEVECDQGRHLTSTSGTTAVRACVCILPPLPARLAHTHTCMYMQTHRYTHKHAYTHADTHTCVCAHTQTHRYTYIYTYTCAHTCRHTHTVPCTMYSF